MLSQRVAGLAGMNCSWSAGARGVRAAPAAVRPARTRLVQLVEAHYRFPNPLQPGTRLTGSKSKKVIRLWENEIALQQVPLIRDEILRVLAHHPDGLLIDHVWTEVRRLVYARQGQFSPVNAGMKLDKPDRTMKGIIERAGFDSLRAFLESLPEIRLEGEGPKTRLHAAAAVPLAAVKPKRGEEPRIVVKRSRIRQLSIQVITDKKQEKAEAAAVKAAAVAEAAAAAAAAASAPTHAPSAFQKAEAEKRLGAAAEKLSAVVARSSREGQSPLEVVSRVIGARRVPAGRAIAGAAARAGNASRPQSGGAASSSGAAAGVRVEVRGRRAAGTAASSAEAAELRGELGGQEKQPLPAPSPAAGDVGQEDPAEAASRAEGMPGWWKKETVRMRQLRASRSGGAR